MLTADRLLLLAETICKSHCTPFPRALKQYCLQWQRENLDLDYAWNLLRPRLEGALPFEPVDGLVRARQADIQAVRDEKLRASCPMLEGPTYDEPWLPWTSLNKPPRKPRVMKDTEDHTPPPSQDAGAEIPKHTRRKREGSKTAECEAFLRLALNQGPVKAATLEARAREQLVLPPGKMLGKYKPMERAKAALGIESRRYGYAADGRWEWRYRPPSWTAKGDRRP
jgi:hypothetical protein